jgi:hypothetical protein
MSSAVIVGRIRLLGESSIQETTGAFIVFTFCTIQIYKLNGNYQQTERKMENGKWKMENGE